MEVRITTIKRFLIVFNIVFKRFLNTIFRSYIWMIWVSMQKFPIGFAFFSVNGISGRFFDLDLVQNNSWYNFESLSESFGIKKSHPYVLFISKSKFRK